MTEADLLALIGSYERSALGSDTASGPVIGGNITPAGQNMTTLEVDRFNAVNAYMGRPLGNEIPDRSQIVLPELRDTIEWIMPQLMRMFVASHRVCQFDPETPGDEEQADQETQVINHVFLKENNGFFILHDLFKDALLLRNGYAKVYWDESEHVSTEEYTGLTEIEVALLLNDPRDTIEPIEQKEEVQFQQDPMSGQSVQYSTFDLKIRRTTKQGRVKVDCLPPEETLVSPRARFNLEECPFWEHKTTLFRSDLIEMGVNEAIVKNIEIAQPTWLNLVSLARDEVVDQLQQDNPSDSPMQEVTFRHVVMRVDFDGDGKAELREIKIAGDQIVSNEETEEIPAISASAIRMPHRHVGISFYDLLNDLQVIKTTLMRQGLDNLYLASNQRTAVNWRTVNLDDLLTSRPGGIIRVDGPPGENLMPMPYGQNVMEQIAPAMDYFDKVNTRRTGVGDSTMGLDTDLLQDVTNGNQMTAMSAASLKIELVARLLAEGVKDLFKKIHSELIRHQDKPMTINLTGKWVEINPSEWRRREKVSVNVGLGSGNRVEGRANLAMLNQMQERIAPFGLVGPKEAYETFKMGVSLLGYESPEKFAKDPNDPNFQPPPPPPNPALQVAQVRAQTDMQKAQLSAQTQQQADQSKLAQQVMDLKARLIQAQGQEESARMKAQAEIMHAYHQSGMDSADAQSQMDHETQLTLLKILGQIAAAQYKQDPSVNAGQALKQDYDSFQ